MNVLLIGPYPPPHGGISVHMVEVREEAERAGMPCRVLNLNRNAPPDPQFLSFRSDLEFLFILLRHARSGWVFHLHANGHNKKNWLVTLAVGLVGQFASGCVLTIHSGTSHIYLAKEHFWRRLVARVSCSLYERIIAVNEQIRTLMVSIGVSPERLEVVPAYFSNSSPQSAADLPAEVAELAQEPGLLLSTSLFFRPEYGFELLIQAVAELRNIHPNLRCLIMGSGEMQAEAERLIKQLRLESTVKLLGDLPHEQCLAVIAASDVFVRANHHDGDSISVREALALGIPTVASDVGHRPVEATLFRAGDLGGLVMKVNATLAAPRPAAPVRISESAQGDAYRLLEIYNQFGVQETGPTPART